MEIPPSQVVLEFSYYGKFLGDSGDAQRKARVVILHRVRRPRGPRLGSLLLWTALHGQSMHNIQKLGAG
jgi:hypothetical protein